MTLKKYLRSGATGAVLTLLLGMVVVSTVSVVNQFAAFRRADSDNIPWNLAQAEVEYLQFRLEVETLLTQGAAPGAQDSIDAVRRNFDVLYSRIATISESPLYSEVRENPRSAGSFDAIQRYFDWAVPIIDASDVGLLDRWAEFTRETRTIGAHLRNLSLSGVAVSTLQSDRGRRDVLSALSIAGLSTLLLFLLLAGVILIVWNTSRKLRRSMYEAEMTGARLSSVISTSPVPIVVSDKKMRIIEYNMAAEASFGFSRAEAIGADVGTLLVPRDLRKAHKAGVHRYFATGHATLIGRKGNRSRALRSDGTEFPVEISLSSGNGPDGRIFVAYIRDLTLDLEKEGELREAHHIALAGERAKERLLNTMSHEMRTPLHGIMAALELLGNTRLTETQLRYMRVTENAAATLLHHVNNVLQVASDTSKHLRIEAAVCDLHELVSGVIDQQRILAAKNGNALSLSAFPEELGYVEVDAHHLRQVLVNLLNNAAKFTHNGTISLRVLVHSATGELEFRVQDDGIGIAQDDQVRIFDDFFTQDASFSHLSSGTGLGLGITRRIIAAMNGSIGVTSSPGEGSTFWFRIPLIRAREPAPDMENPARDGLPVPATGASLGALDVLVVEDNEINRMVIGEALAASSINVTMASDGLEGVELAAQQRFDCILMDISMPGISGVDALHLIRKGNGLSKDTPVFAVTAHVLADDRKRFVEAGFDRVIAKPFSFKALVDEIASAASGQAPGPSSPETNEAALINPANITEMRLTFGRDKTADLLAAFLGDGRKSLDRVTNLAQRREQDLAAVASELHRFKGTAAILGAEALAARLQDLELQATRHNSPPSAEQLAELGRLLDCSVVSLQEVIADAD